MTATWALWQVKRAYRNLCKQCPGPCEWFCERHFIGQILKAPAVCIGMPVARKGLCQHGERVKAVLIKTQLWNCFEFAGSLCESEANKVVVIGPGTLGSMKSCTFFKKPAHHWCIPKCYEVGTCMDGMTGEQPQLPHLQVSPRQISTPGRNDQERVGDTDGNTTVQCECRSCIQTYSVLCDIVSVKIPPARDLRTLLWLEVRSPSRREAQMVKLNVAYQAPKKTPLSCFAEYGHSGPVWSCAMRLCSIELCCVRAGLHQPSTCWPGRCSIHPSNALNTILPSLLLSAEGESGPERDCWRISFEPPLRSISFILQVWKFGDVGDVLRDMLALVTLGTLRLCRWNPPRFEAISWSSYPRSRCDCWPGSITTPVAAAGDAGDAFDGVTSTASTTRPSHLGCTNWVVALNGGS